jgi:hypothetical protein
MRYYAQNMMKLKLTKEEIECCKKFVNFLSEYAEKIDDDIQTLYDIITIMEDIDGSECDKELLLKEYRIDFEVI